MPGAARLAQEMACFGGVTMFPVACSVLVNGKPAAHLGTLCKPHPPWTKKPNPHNFPQPVIKASCSVTVEGKPMARAGDRVACSCVLIIGSCDVLVGG